MRTLSHSNRTLDGLRASVAKLTHRPRRRDQERSCPSSRPIPAQPAARHPTWCTCAQPGSAWSWTHATARCPPSCTGATTSAIVTPDELAALAVASVPGAVPNDLDEATPFQALLAEHSAGWNGRPGLTGSRSGRGWSPRFAAHRVAGHRTTRRAAAGCSPTATDEAAGLAVRIEVELLPSGLVRQRAAVTATADRRARLRGGRPGADPPGAARSRRSCSTWPDAGAASGHRSGCPSSSGCTPGRTGAAAPARTRRSCWPPAPPASTRGRARSGPCTWPGAATTSHYAERVSTGEQPCSAAASCCCPARSCSRAGESYAGPWIYGAHGIGPRRCRRPLPRPPARPAAPPAPADRPVALNTWEAVYFDHDLDRLHRAGRRGGGGRGRALRPRRRLVPAPAATTPRASATGTSTRASGRDGLHPLVDRVRGLGMEFGLWVEPEMVNLDSDLARAHPDWMLRPAAVARRSTSRYQQVLDLAHPGGLRATCSSGSIALLTEYPIAYLKWDHNRDLLEAGRSPRGRPGRARADRWPSTGCSTSCAPGTRAWRSSRARPAGCASTSRCWSTPTGSGAATCIDPLERQQIQRWTAQLLPPELVGSPRRRSGRSHTTGRTPRPGLPGRHRAVRLVRHRVGPDRGVGGRAQGAGVLGGALQGDAGS